MPLVYLAIGTTFGLVLGALLSAAKRADQQQDAQFYASLEPRGDQ